MAQRAQVHVPWCIWPKKWPSRSGFAHVIIFLSGYSRTVFLKMRRQMRDRCGGIVYNRGNEKWGVNVSFKETDLYAPTKAWFEARGCVVKSEVCGFDLLAEMPVESLCSAPAEGEAPVYIGVELKQRLNLELINQAVERQVLADMVYVCVPHVYKTVQSGRFQSTLLTLKRLGIGVMTVNFRSSPPEVYVLQEPERFDYARYRKRRQRKRRQLIEEFNRRSGDFNVGGSTRIPLMTAYRERALRVAMHLEALGEAGAGEVAGRDADFRGEALTRAQASSILVGNPYKWFKRVSRGCYILDEAGREALKVHASVVCFLSESREGTETEA